MILYCQAAGASLAGPSQSLLAGAYATDQTRPNKGGNEERSSGIPGVYARYTGSQYSELVGWHHKWSFTHMTYIWHTYDEHTNHLEAPIKKQRQHHKNMLIIWDHSPKYAWTCLEIFRTCVTSNQKLRTHGSDIKEPVLSAESLETLPDGWRVWPKPCGGQPAVLFDVFLLTGPALGCTTRGQPKL